MLNKVETLRRYKIFRHKSIGRRLVRPEASKLIQPARSNFPPEGDFEEVNAQLREVYNSLGQMIADSPLSAKGKVLVNPRDFKHLFKCLETVDTYLEFLNGPDGKEASNDTI